MLKQLRNKKTSKKILIGLAIVIIPAFALWGFSSAIRKPGESLYVGTIFGKRITASEYNNARVAVKNMSIMLYGDKFPEMQKLLNIETQAWERLILLQEAKKHKIGVSNQEVIKTIASYPIFQRKGQFDDKQYSELLQYVFRTQPRSFEEQIRQNLILTQLYGQVTDDVVLNEEGVKSEYRKLNEEISIYYIAGVPSEFSENIAPSEEELKDYFSKYSLEFKQPLSFNIEYVSTDTEDSIKEMGLRLKKPIFSRLRFVGKPADKGIDLFGNSAQELGLEVKESGLFTQVDSIPGIGWSPQILNLIIKLEQGQFSPIIQMDNNYYILRLKEKKEPHIPDLEQIKDKVQEAFMKKRSLDIAKEKIDNCSQKLKENLQTANFDKTAKEYGLKSGSTELFKFGSYIEGIGASDILWLTTQKLKDDEFSNVVDMKEAGFYIIKLKERIPLDENKFESEKEEFSERILQLKKQEQFLDFTEDLKRKARLF